MWNPIKRERNVSLKYTNLKGLNFFWMDFVNRLKMFLLVLHWSALLCGCCPTNMHIVHCTVYILMANQEVNGKCTKCLTKCSSFRFANIPLMIVNTSLPFVSLKTCAFLAPAVANEGSMNGWMIHGRREAATYKLQNVFVQIAKCICLNSKMYLSKFWKGSVNGCEWYMGRGEWGGKLDELVTRFPNCNSTLSTPTERNTLLTNTLLENTLLKKTLRRL